ncbi:ClpP family protease [Variovorax sp. KK3]|uniref:ClpP family protease n=1 Tax=Variovorax sp. KK3 TaxID=1855728 RepID=UPI00097C61BC|nr:ATP-dependent Clp protease proteolytic subunit [Variovorax sp. KK3]
MATAKKAKAASAAAAVPREQQAWIRFMAPVIPQTVTPLFQSIDQALNAGAKHLHLMLSSPGGSVFHGLSAHNYLRGLGIPVTTYNFGSVDSIGVVIFCSGQERICVPHARFLIHGVSFNTTGPMTLDEKGLEEHLKSVKIDAQNIARVIADTSTKSLHDVEKDMLDRTTLNPQQAKEYGLVTEVKKALFAGGHLYSIYESGQVFQATLGLEQLAHTTNMQMNYSSPSAARNSTIPLIDQ